MKPLQEHQHELEGLAQLLIEKETLTRDEFLEFIASCQPVETEGAVQ